MDFKQTEDKVLDIINRVKQLELEKGKKEEDINYSYTHGECRDLAMLVKSQFLNNQEVKVLFMRLQAEEICHQAIVLTDCEYPKEHFDNKGCFYDINGKTPLYKAGEYLHSFGESEEANLPHQITLNYLPFSKCFEKNETTFAVFQQLKLEDSESCTLDFNQ